MDLINQKIQDIDRTIILNHTESILKDISISSLFPNQISTSIFYTLIPLKYRNDSKLDQIISNIASVHQSDQDYVFRLKILNDMNFNSPHIDLSKALQFLTRHSEKFSDKLLQVPNVSSVSSRSFFQIFSYLVNWREF